MSAAKAGPDAIASAAASKAAFFMTIPILFEVQPKSGPHKGMRYPAMIESLNFGTVGRGLGTRKQKRQASAAFLSVI
jgi:hypothetical protein